MPKDTRESILASGLLTIIRPPDAITKAPHAPFANIGITRAQLYSDLPAPWLKVVKTPSEMTSKELDRELGKQFTRLGKAKYFYGDYKGPTAAEDYVMARRLALGLSNDLGGDATEMAFAA
jgi:hypothetical protein